MKNIAELPSIQETRLPEKELRRQLHDELKRVIQDPMDFEREMRNLDLMFQQAAKFHLKFENFKNFQKYSRTIQNVIRKIFETFQ